MIIGTREEIERYQKTCKDPERLKTIQSSLVWINDTHWFIPQKTDSAEDKLLQEYMIRYSRLMTLDEVRAYNSSAPPHKNEGNPPTLFHKVASYWRAVTGPKVSDEEYQHRLTQCTKVGGCTFSPIHGIVDSISHDKVYKITISGQEIILPLDETPIVKVGQSVVAGEVLSTTSSIKPCQYCVSEIDKKTNEKSHWCTVCQCGKTERAKLENKLKLSRISCPRIPPLF